MNQNRQFNLAVEQCKNLDLRKIKLDTLLMIVHHLLSGYKKEDLLNCSSKIINVSQDELNFIDNNICSLHKYLDNNIITAQTLFNIFTNRNKSVLVNKLATNLEPMKAYYKYLTSLFSSKLSSGSNWVPELFALSLLYTYKQEFGKSLSPYPFLDDFPLDRIINIYNQNNLELKKSISKLENKSIWKVKTVLDDMYNTSEFLAKKYLEYSFKINNNRVSKFRNKKKKVKA